MINVSYDRIDGILSRMYNMCYLMDGRMYLLLIRLYIYNVFTSPACLDWTYCRCILY